MMRLSAVVTTIVLVFAGSVYAAEPSLEERIAVLEEQLANLTAESQRVFSFGAQLRVDRQDINFEDESLILNRLRFLFNANAEVSPRLAFFSQFGVSKYLNIVERQRYIEADANTNFYGSEQNAGNAVRLSRAYFEYYPESAPMAISIGRLPTMDGPPGHFRLNLPRQATYPQLAYNVEMDGIALSYWLDDSLPKDHKLIFRGIYTPFTHVNYNRKVKSVERPDVVVGDNGDAISGIRGTKDTEDLVISGMVEYTVDRASWFDHAETIFQVIHWKDGSFADPDDVNMGALGTGKIMSYPEGMLDLTIWTLYQEFTNVFGTGLDFSASYSQSIIDNKKLAGFSSSQLNPFTYDQHKGLRSNTTGEVSAGIFLISVVQNLPIASLNRPRLGFEYLHGDRNVLTTNEFNQLDDESGFYATMGDAYHAYYSQDINENLSFQLGFRLQKQQYDIPKITLAGQSNVYTNLGSAEKDRKTIETVYLRGLLNF